TVVVVAALVSGVRIGAVVVVAVIIRCRADGCRTDRRSADRCGGWTPADAAPHIGTTIHAASIHSATDGAGAIDAAADRTDAARAAAASIRHGFSGDAGETNDGRRRNGSDNAIRHSVSLLT